jgi:hypothetical protein
VFPDEPSPGTTDYVDHKVERLEREVRRLAAIVDDLLKNPDIDNARRGPLKGSRMAHGTGTIAAGNANVLVNHGLPVAPALTDILITPTAQGAVDDPIVVDPTFTPTSTQFRVAKTGGAAAGNISFTWWVQVL